MCHPDTGTETTRQTRCAGDTGTAFRAAVTAAGTEQQELRPGGGQEASDTGPFPAVGFLCGTLMEEGGPGGDRVRLAL